MAGITSIPSLFFFAGLPLGLGGGAVIHEWQRGEVARERPGASAPSQAFETSLRTCFTGATLIGAGFFGGLALEAVPRVVARFRVNHAEQIAQHAVTRSWPGRTAVLAATAAGIGVGILWASQIASGATS